MKIQGILFFIKCTKMLCCFLQNMEVKILTVERLFNYNIYSKTVEHKFNCCADI